MYTQIITKKKVIIIILFFFIVYKNEWKECKFWRQKNLKSDFYKNKKLNIIDNIDVKKTLVSKKNHTAQKYHLNILLDIIIMMLLDHYVQNFHKWLAML